MSTSTPIADLHGLNPAQAAAVRALGASAGGASASRLLALLYDPEVDVDRILHCLHAEPVLAARVLKVANAPYYGQSGRVGSVPRAVQLLGLSAIRAIAAAGALDRLMPKGAGQGFDPTRFRRHAGAVALAAQSLSREARLDVDGEAFLAGLLHDIGVLLLIKADAAAMSSFQPPCSGDDGLDAAAEATHFGLTHEAAGAVLVQSWALPAWLQSAVAGHHAALGEPLPAGDGPARLPLIVGLAERLAGQAGFGLWPRCEGPLDERALAALGLDAGTVQAIAEALPAGVEALGLDS